MPRPRKQLLSIPTWHASSQNPAHVRTWHFCLPVMLLELQSGWLWIAARLVNDLYIQYLFRCWNTIEKNQDLWFSLSKTTFILKVNKFVEILIRSKPADTEPAVRNCRAMTIQALESLTWRRFWFHYTTGNKQSPASPFRCCNGTPEWCNRWRHFVLLQLKLRSNCSLNNGRGAICM